jgi:two-component system, OmpR family, KDP operon response regulator KdpE
MSLGRILIVDDDPQIRRVMKMTLTGEGYEVAEARSGEEAQIELRASPYDLMLLDMVLTVRNTEKDKVSALDAGADDFITKPFSSPELLARIRAVLRRAPAPPEGGPKQLTLGGVEIDFQARKVLVGGEQLHLTPKEFDLLRYLVLNPNRAIPHRELLQAVWGPDYGDQVEYLRVFIKQLRRKIEAKPDKPVYLLTEPWVGYRFALPAQ